MPRGALRQRAGRSFRLADCSSVNISISLTGAPPRPSASLLQLPIFQQCAGLRSTGRQQFRVMSPWRGTQGGLT